MYLPLSGYTISPFIYVHNHSFRELSKCPGGQQVAKDTFAQHKSFYHKIAANMIEKDLGLV